MLPSWPPRRPAALTTGAALLGAVACLMPDVRGAAVGAAWFGIEAVSIVLDRPTSLVVAGYAVVVALGLAVDLRRDGRLSRILGLLPGALALVTVGYLGAFAWKLRPRLLLATVALLPVGWLLARVVAGGAREHPRPAPILGLFVALHVAVEATSGHILTWVLQGWSGGMASLSYASPWLYDVAAAALVLGPTALLVPGSAPRLWAWIGGCVALVGSLPGSPAGPACVLAGLLAGAALQTRGRGVLDWLSPWPSRTLQSVAPVALAILAVVAAHYTDAQWRCGALSEAQRAFTLVDRSDGTFDLAPDEAGRLVVARREARQLLVLDPAGTVLRRVDTARATDSWLDHTEPETLVPLGGSAFLVLLASSDGVVGNRLVRFDAATGALGPEVPGLGDGVSDLVRDGRGGVWMSTEYRGRIARLDPQALRVGLQFELPGAETNKIAVDIDRNRAWSVGLWSDGQLRQVDLNTGRQIGSRWIGTHQWDFAFAPQTDRLYVARLVDGEVLELDATSLEVLQRWGWGFGVRPIEVSPDGRTLAVGNLYRGEVEVWDLTGERESVTARIGGHIKALHLAADGSLYAGSDCGVFVMPPR